MKISPVLKGIICITIGIVMGLGTICLFPGVNPAEWGFIEGGNFILGAAITFVLLIVGVGWLIDASRER